MYTHVYDLANEYITIKNPITLQNERVPDDTPKRYANSGVQNNYCFGEVEITNGSTLNNGSIMMRQQSCKPNAANAGNEYTFATALAGFSTVTSNSACAKGWQIPRYETDNNRSYSWLIEVVYSAKSGSDQEVRVLPLSFTRSGSFGINTNTNLGSGFYWTPKLYNTYDAGGFILGSNGYGTQGSSFSGGTNSLSCF